jgi:serine/threonine protein kinase
LQQIEEILDALCGGRSTLDEAAAGLLRARAGGSADEAAISAVLQRRVATGALSAESAAALARTPSPADVSAALTRLRPATGRPVPVEPPQSSSPPEASSGWRKWAESDVQGARLGVGDVLRDRFAIEENIGEGGMGLVFRARDRRREEARDRNPFVAIKVLGDDFKSHPDALVALQREARRMQNLSHPNIASVYDFDRDGAHVYLVMELLEGESLDKLLARQANSGLPPEQARQVIRGAGSALRHAHSKGVVHSDFKPANVFVTRSGEVKVIDFGIARIAKDSTPGAETALTVFDAGRLGAYTNAYASPEQILDAEEPDPRDDIYALGLVAYEALTGRHPFGRKSAVDARFRELKVEPVQGLTEAQNAALAAALCFDRKQRLPDVSELLDAFDPDQAAIVATRDGTQPRRTGGEAAEVAPARRRIGRTIALAIAGIAWAAFFAVYWYSRESPPPDGAGPETQAVTDAAPSPAPQAVPGPEVKVVAEPAQVRVAKPAATARPKPASGKAAPVTSAGDGPLASATSPEVGTQPRQSSSPSKGAGDAAPEPVDAPGAVADTSAAAQSESSGDPQPGGSQLYRWVDKEGKVQFGEKPPQEYADSAVKIMD